MTATVAASRKINPVSCVIMVLEVFFRPIRSRIGVSRVDLSCVVAIIVQELTLSESLYVRLIF